MTGGEPDVLVIGAGVSGLTTAICLAEAGPSVRLEAESLDGGRLLVHYYGHGGAGVTLSWGCAQDVAALVVA